MLCALVADVDGVATVQRMEADGGPVGAPERFASVVEAVRAHEGERPRWVWAATEDVYPALLRDGVRVDRCHDLALAEAVLLGYEEQWGAPRSLAAVWARLHGEPVPADPQPRSRDHQPTLFEPGPAGLPDGVAPLTAVVAAYRSQRERAARVEHPERMALLLAAESAGALVAAEMEHAGLPWRADLHDALLTELLGPRTPAGVRPPRLSALAAEVSAAFGGRPVNPDSPADVLRAFTAAGLSVPSTRSWVVRGLDHPAAAPLLAYKELARLHSAHGWSWLDTWVHEGRFRPTYVPAGVVSGRWATRGGGALQIPKTVRRAVVADPGWVLVVADAAQLEPRVLAALAGDRRLAAAAADGDLYAAIAADAFDGDRARAKVAVLGAIYGQTSGEGGRLLAVLRQRFPDAVGYVEAAARAGEQGRVVRSHLGRTCPGPSVGWWRALDGTGPVGAESADGTGGADGWGDAPAEAGAAEAAGGARRAARSRGRFTRNFVVQATATEWAVTLLAVLRRHLATMPSTDGRPELVFFQHDEFLVHCPEPAAAEVVTAMRDAADQAGRLVFGPTPVRFPLDVSVVGCYANAT